MKVRIFEFVGFRFQLIDIEPVASCCLMIRLNLAAISQQKNKKAVVSWHNSYSE